MATSLPLIGSAEACERLGIDRSTLTRRIARGQITAVQKLPGETGAYLFEAAEIERAKAVQDAINEAKAASA
jgi:excisionase family DNA binding protein